MKIPTIEILFALVGVTFAIVLWTFWHALAPNAAMKSLYTLHLVSSPPPDGSPITPTLAPQSPSSIPGIQQNSPSQTNETTITNIVSSTQNDTGSLLLNAGKAIQVDGLTISNGGVTSFQGASGDVTLTAGSGLSIDGVKFENSDRGSTQNIFKNIAVDGQNTIVADTNDDTLTFAAGQGITLLTDRETGKLTITGANSATATGFTKSGSNVYLSTSSDSVGIGTSSPVSKFSVGSTSQFQVNSSGVIAAAAGLTSSGPITFSGLSTGVVINTAGTLSSEAQLAVSRGGTGLSSYIVGDLPYASASTTLSKLGIGSSGLVLTSTGSAPTWSTIGAAGITADSLDFSEFKDSMTLDAATTIANGGFNFSITGTGNFGIGDASPASLLTVGSGDLFQVNSSGAIAAATGMTSSGTIAFSGLSTNGLVKTTGGTGTLAVASAGSDYQAPLTFTNGLTNSSNTVTLGGTLTQTTTLANAGFNFAITGTGNVGIGTAAPATRLDITGLTLNTDATNTVMVENQTGSITKNDSNTRQFYGLKIKPTLNTGASNAATTFNIFDLDTTNTAVTGLTTNLMSLSYGGTNRLTVQSAGNVGIGTTAPNGPLQVVGSSTRVATFDSSSTAPYITVRSTVTNTPELKFTIDATSTPYGKIEAGDGAAWRNLALQPSGGNVGIATTSPAGKLDIGPTITAVASATNYSLRIDPTLSGAINTAQTALYQNYNVPTINLTGGTSNTLTTLYGNYTGLTNTAGTVSTWYGDYIAAPTGAGTTTNKYALVTEANAGNIGVGTTSPTTFKLEVGGAIGPTTDNTFDFGSSGKRWVNLYASNGTVQTSDARLKDNIQNIDYGLDTLMKLRPVSFNWKGQPDSGRKLGLIAQEVQPIVGEVVKQGDDPDHTLGIYYTDLIPVVIKSIQEQQKEIDMLDTKVQDKGMTDTATIAGKIDALTTQTGQMKNDLIQVHTALDSQKEEIASLSAKLAQGLADIETLKGSVLSASTSALLSSTLSTSTLSSLATSSAVLDDLTVTGKTNVNDLGVTGSISAGLLAITGLDTSDSTPSANIETLSGPLHLQKNGLGPLKLMADQIVIDEKGNLALQEGNIELKKGKFIGNDTIRGVVTLPAGQHKVTVKQAWDVAPTSITATTTYDAHLWIEDLTKDGFTANVNPAATSEAKIYWSAIW